MSEKEIATHPDGGYGWIIVLATTSINICVLPLIQYFGIIFQSEFESMGVTGAETSFLLHLHSAIYCSLGLLSSPLLKKFNYRQVALFGTSFMCFGIFLSSFANSYNILITTVSIIGFQNQKLQTNSYVSKFLGIGQGILLPATYVATNTYFKKKLTLAVCFSVTGVGIFSVFMPQLCTKLLVDYGRTVTVFVLFSLSLFAIIFCCLLKPIKKTFTNDDLVTMERLKPQTDDQLVYKETTIRIEQTTIFSTITKLFDLELLKDRPYIIAIIGMSVSFASELNVILMIAFVLPELANMGKKDVAFVLSIQSIADIAGRLIVPLGANSCKIPPKIMYATSLLTSSIGRTVLAVFYQSRLTIFLCAILFGLAKGTKAVYQSVIIPQLVTLEKLPAANGLNMLLTGSLSLIIGPVLGTIHDFFKSYIYALHAASVLSLFCVFLWILDYVLQKIKR